MQFVLSTSIFHQQQKKSHTYTKQTDKQQTTKIKHRSSSDRNVMRFLFLLTETQTKINNNFAMSKL